MSFLDRFLNLFFDVNDDDYDHEPEKRYDDNYSDRIYRELRRRGYNDDDAQRWTDFILDGGDMPERGDG